MQYLETILKFFEPHLIEILAGVLTLIGTLVGLAVRRVLGLQAEELLRKALHSALTTGALQASSTDPNKVAEQAVQYAQKSVPEAIKRLNPRNDVLYKLARAKVVDLLRK